MTVKRAHSQHYFSVHRSVHATLQGVLWAWVFGFLGLLFYWQQHGFTDTKTHVFQEIQKTQQILTPYQESDVFRAMFSLYMKFSRLDDFFKNDTRRSR